jgi:glycerol-3-phosphate dehydrogenase subunit C
MKEGSTEAPTRHPIEWREPDFYDREKIDVELRRVFDICHGCRRCFNLCDSFPRLFDLVDASPTEDVDGVSSEAFKTVVDACTLCDMCFMTKCPYVPPHEFDLDFPHLMLRYRAAQFKAGETGFVHRQLGKTDRNGKLARLAAPLVNWASDEKNGATRGLMEKVAGIHREAALPPYQGRTLTARAKTAPELNRSAPAYGRKAVLYATCFAEYNRPEIGEATRAVLARNGVETEVVHPGCCGMPLLEQGAMEEVARAAAQVSAALKPWIEKGYDVIALVPSCALMLKFEWPLIEPASADVKLLAEATYDVAEYVVELAKKHGLADGLKPLAGGVAIHLACHARAQNMGPKGAEMLRLIPETPVEVIERCSGHGGAWGVLKENFETALKVGKPVARTGRKSARAYLASECPLAADHVRQGMERVESDKAPPETVLHPILLFAKAYGMEVQA